MSARALCAGVIALAAWLAGSEARAAVDPEDMARFKAFCETHACRRNLDVAVRREDGTIFHERQPLAQPPVQDRMLTVYPGETITAFAEMADNRLVRWHEATGEPPPGWTRVTVHLEQVDDDDDVGMMATIQNDGPMHLKFTLKIARIDQDGIEYTSSCPVGPGGGSYELWPEPLLMLIVGDVRDIGIAGSQTCI